MITESVSAVSAECRSGAAASTDYGSSVFNQNLHVAGEVLSMHAVDCIAAVVDDRHTCVWFGNNRN